MFWIVTLSRLGAGTGVVVPPVPWRECAGGRRGARPGHRWAAAIDSTLDEIVKVVEDPPLRRDDRSRGMRAIERDVALPRRGEPFRSGRNPRRQPGEMGTRLGGVLRPGQRAHDGLDVANDPLKACLDRRGAAVESSTLGSMASTLGERPLFVLRMASSSGCAQYLLYHTKWAQAGNGSGVERRTRDGTGTWRNHGAIGTERTGEMDGTTS